MKHQLWAWEYEGQEEVGTQKSGNSCVFKSAASEAIPILRHTDHITNLRKVKVVDADAVSNDAACPCFACQCEPNQVTKDAIEEARNPKV